MQVESIRMKAEAISFNTIKVYLSTNYYNGISSKFYLKDLGNKQSQLLNGDMTGEEHGFKTYELHAKIKLGHKYIVTDAYGLTCYVDVTPIGMTKEFDDLYYYDGDDLGNHYSKISTKFKVWAPLSTNVTLKVFNDKETLLYPMERGKKGVYETVVYKDLELYEYVYIVEHHEMITESPDPYAYSSSSNMGSSIIVDINQCPIKKYPLDHLKKNTDAIIYEVGVRDFSVDSYGELRHKGKFLAFSEEGNTTSMNYSSGVDYLEELGITHVQLMPVNDFATVDEDAPYELYNWGYDPQQYNVTEGSYVTLPSDGYRRITECQNMVNNIHKHHMRVILDVVYNHMHDVNNNALEKTVPYYFFRRDHEGHLTNGTWCGNDLNSTAKMCRKYILNMCKRWQVLYGVDGFRMDLMGILDVETVNLIYKQGKEINDSFLLYGEGWNMGTLPQEEKASMDNHAKLPNIGFFNDFFRDTVRGSNDMATKGYISGDTYKTNEMAIAMCDYGKFTSIGQSINYVECHDNGTIYDKLNVSNVEENDFAKQRRATMALAMVLLSQGVPFIHAGQEFYGTKGGHVNSYNAGDSVNKFDWGRKDQYIDNVETIKKIIEIRKNNKCFRYDSFDTMREHIQVNNINHRMIEYKLTQTKGDYKEFRIYFNPSYDRMSVLIDEGFNVLYSMENEVISNNTLNIEGISMVICAK